MYSCSGGEEMKEKWRIESEADSTGIEPVWAMIEGPEGRRTAVAVIQTATDTASRVLSQGMMYLKGPETQGSILFSIKSCTRARLQGCMLIRADEAVNPGRSRENAVLREMNRILELEVTGNQCREIAGFSCHGAAS